MSDFDADRLPLEGTQLIEASAGTGKTYTIATLLARLVVEEGLDVGEILVVTYTDAAAAELADRIRARLRAAALAAEARIGGAPLAKVEPAVHELLERAAERGELEAARDRLFAALYAIDDNAISTIHGFCQRALQENAFESGSAFDLELVGVDHALVTDVAWDAWTAALHDASPAWVDALRTHRVGGERLGPELLARLIELAGPDPDVCLLTPPEGPPIDDAAQAWLEAAREAARIHEAQRDEIETLVGESSALNKGSYQDRRVRQALPALMERLRRATAPGLPKKDDLGLVAAFAQGTMKTKKGEAEPEHPFFEAMAELHASEVQWQGARDGAVGAFLRDALARGRSALAERKQEAGLLFFDDLLRDLALALRGPTGESLAERLRARFAVALIDEFQDTDPLQYEIFRRVFGEAGRPLLLVGDPKQAIYGFRGADVFAYLRARRDSGAAVHDLATNYRSDPGLIEAVNRLFDGAQRPFLIDEIAFKPVQARRDAQPGIERGQADQAAPLQILHLAPGSGKGALAKGQAEKAAAAAVAQDIARLLASDARVGKRQEPVRADHVAVLCRSHAQARRMKQALRRVRVPAIERGDKSVFETDEAEQLEWILRGLLAGHDLSRVRAALGTAVVGLSARDLALLDAGPDAAWDEWLAKAAFWRELWRERGVVVALERLFDDCDFVARTLASEGGERVVTDVQHLVELLHDVVTRERLGPESLVEWLCVQRLDPGARTHADRESVQLRLESDAESVELLTVHGSKGLEYPIVYCPFLFDSSLPRMLERSWTPFHDPSRDDARVLDLGSPEHEAHLARADLESLAEGLRLTYVALTRARHRCVVVWGHVQGMKDSALAYLLHQPEHAEAALDAAGWLAQHRARFDSKSKQRIGGDEILADLHRVAERAPGCIAVREAAGDEMPASTVGASAEPAALSTRATLSAKVAERTLDVRRRTSSFSGLVGERRDATTAQAASPAGDVRPSDEGLDHDAVQRIAQAALEADLAPYFTQAISESDAASAVDAPADLPTDLPAGAAVAPADLPTDLPAGAAVTLADFPAGAAVGTALHAVLEQVDFIRAGEDDQREAALRTLDRHGVAARWAGRFVAALPAIVAAPLADGARGVRLADIARSDRVDELEFIVPVAIDADDRSRGAAVSAASLAAVFDRHAQSDTIRGYAARLAELAFLPLEGFLKGFVDLVFRHDGRWHVVDYKSNHLGPSVADYAPSKLEGPMIEHDYILQYHLYVLALHRQLAWRLPDYDHDRDMGDVFYLFLRGLSAAHPTGTGVYRDRPPAALVEALSQLFSGEGADAASGGAAGRRGGAR